MLDTYFILRRGSAIEILQYSNRLFMPRMADGVLVTRKDIMPYGRILGFAEEDANPIFILELPDDRLPVPTNFAAIHAGLENGTAVTPEHVPRFPHGVIVTRADLQRAADAGKVLESNLPFMRHALAYAEGTIDLPRLTGEPGGNGPLLLQQPPADNPA